MSSNVIPSPESNAPPPVHCILSRGSHQFEAKRADVNFVSGSSASDHNTFESYLGDLGEESQVDGGRTFTQVDDFREAPSSAPEISLDIHSEETSLSKLWPRNQVSESPGSTPNVQRSSCISDRPTDNQETPLLFEISDTAPSVISASNYHRSQTVRMDIDDTSNCTSEICKLADGGKNTTSFVAQSVSPDAGNNLKEGSPAVVSSSKSASVVDGSQAKYDHAGSVCRTMLPSPKCAKRASKCLISAQLSITSHPLDEPPGATSMPSNQLFFYGFSSQLDSLSGSSGLVNIRQRSHHMFSEFDKFWVSFVRSYQVSELSPVSGPTFTGPHSDVSDQQLMIESCSSIAAVSSVCQSRSPSRNVEENTVHPAVSRVGLPVYGRWHSEPYYYAGRIPEPSQTGRRHVVVFDDGSKARLRAADILLLELLPVNTEVYVDWNDSSEYQGSCLVTAHSGCPSKPYEIRRNSDGVRRMFPRKNVAVHHTELCHLRNQDQLPPVTSEDVLQSALNRSIHTKELSVALAPNIDHSVMSDISLTNMVFGKRKRTCKQPPCDIQKEAPQDRKPLSVSNVPPSKRVRLFNRHRRSGRSVSRRTFRRFRCQTGSDSDEEPLTQPMHNAGQSSRLRDTSIFRIPGVAASANYYLRRSLCRSLNLPLASCSLFRGWTVIFTGRFPNMYTSSAGSSDGDREILKKLILATGGQVSTPIFSCLMTPENKENDEYSFGQGRHIALVATEPCRTLKYFQALATLGRVPLLRAKWILDVIRREAAEAQTQEDNEDGELTSSSRIAECINWPLRLLIDRPGRYELPRGVLESTGELISWSSVPIHYRSKSQGIMPTPSLFDSPTEWSVQPCQLIAIVTDDFTVFGPAWLTILQLAHGAKLVPGTMDPWPLPVAERQRIPPILSMQNAVQCLGSFVIEPSSTDCSRGNLVLVDRNKLDSSILSELRLLPLQLVTSDYFIQSLICGQLLDPESSSMFVPHVD